MYHALLNLQQRTRPASSAARGGPSAEGAGGPAATTDSPPAMRHERADASLAAQGALEQAQRLLEAHHDLPDALVATPPDQSARTTKARQIEADRQTPVAATSATIAAADVSAVEGAAASPAPVVQRLVRLLGDPLAMGPLRVLAQRLAEDRQACGCRTQWLVAVAPSRGVEEVGLAAAACLAELPDFRGAEVLLVDADLKHRRLSQALGYGDQPGLVECLLGRSPGRDLCRPSGLAHLWVLPGGQFVDARPLVGVAVAGWSELVDSFGAVLLCGGTTDDPWATALAGLADAAYVVVELGRVDEWAARAAVGRLREQGARVLGCIATSGEMFPT